MSNIQIFYQQSLLKGVSYYKLQIIVPSSPTIFEFFLLNIEGVLELKYVLLTILFY